MIQYKWIAFNRNSVDQNRAGRHGSYVAADADSRARWLVTQWVSLANLIDNNLRLVRTTL